jgi:hypothetical protein
LDENEFNERIKQAKEKLYWDDLKILSEYIAEAAREETEKEEMKK